MKFHYQVKVTIKVRKPDYASESSQPAVWTF